jgi:hypothetical protein
MPFEDLVTELLAHFQFPDLGFRWGFDDAREYLKGGLFRKEGKIEKSRFLRTGLTYLPISINSKNYI